MRALDTSVNWLLCFLMAASLPIIAANRVILDTDSGPFNDDGVALVILLHNLPRESVQAITVVSGNVWAQQGAEYMLHTLGLMHRPDVPVYVGAHLPLLQSVERAAYAEQHFGPISFKGALAEKYPSTRADLKPPYGGHFSEHRPESKTAVEALIETIEKDPGNVTILAIGPMTNLAMALRLRPDLETKIGRLVFMGGNVHVPGNVTAAAEFNFWFDPEAAQIVFRSAIREKVMFGLDICNHAHLTKPLFDRIVAVKTPITDVYREDFGRRYPGFLTNADATQFLWDELAAAYLADPSFVTRSEQSLLDVDTSFGPNYGAVIRLDRARAPHATPTHVMLDLDFPKFERIYVNTLTTAGQSH